jgi:hypothetical protein
MAVRILSSDLEKRSTKIKELLAPLTVNTSTLDVRQLPNMPNYVLSALSRGLRLMTLTDPAEVRVPTKWDGVFFNYHEIWIHDGSKFYVLNRAYLHIYISQESARNDLQTLSLHCDPSMQPSEAGYSYKRGPHLHLHTSQPNIERAHISLCVGDKQFGGSNIGALMTKLSASVKMISDEVIPKYE